ncbi:MAG: hypothetical protein ACOYJY_03340 [Acutalibacteraceae bacterium]|jgi:hypothetical protein
MKREESDVMLAQLLSRSNGRRTSFWRQAAILAAAVLAAVVAVELFVFNASAFRLWFGSFEPGSFSMDQATRIVGMTESQEEPGVYVAQSRTPYVEFQVDRTLGTIRLDGDILREDRHQLLVDILYTDEAHHNLIESPAYLELLKHTPHTQYKTCFFAGKSERLRLRLRVDVGERIAIRGVEVNQPVPMTFRVYRVLLLWGLVMGIWLLCRAPSFVKKAGKNAVSRWAPVVITGLFAFSLWGLFAVYDTPYLHAKSFTQKQGDQISQELVDAIEAGQTALLEEPSRDLLQMQYPYEWAERTATEVDYAWDHLLYNGRYYSYYGVAPVLTLFLPYHLLTGYYFPTDYAVLLFGLLGAVFLGAAYNALARRKMRDLPLGMTMAGLILVLCSSGIQFSVYRPKFYEVAETAGMMFMAIALYALATSGLLGDKPIKLARLAVSATAMSLAVLSRPTLAVYALSAVVWLWFGLKSYRRQTDLRRKAPVVKYALAALLPYLLFGGGQMVYNFVRFGSPLEFGIRYSLTINDFTHTQFHWRLAGVSLYNLLIALPQFQLNFPFIHGTTHQLETNAYYFFETGSAIGLLWRALPLGGLAYAPRVMRRMDRRRMVRLLLIVGLPTVIFPLGLIALTWESGYALRYSVDFAWQLVLGGLLVCFAVWRRCRSERMKRFLFTALVLSAVWCFVSTTALALAPLPSDLVVGGRNLQLEYLRLARDWTFWK